MKHARLWKVIVCAMVLLTIFCAVGMAEGDLWVQAPRYVYKNQNIQFMLGSRETYTNIGIGIYDVSGSDEYPVDQIIVSTNVETTVSTQNMMPWHVYKFVMIQGPRDEYMPEFYVRVLGEQESRLTIDLPTEEPIYFNEPYEITVSAPEGVTFVRMYRMDDPFWYEDLYPDQGMSCWVSASDATSFFACCSYSPYDYGEPMFTGMSNMLEFVPYSNGSATAAEVTMQDTIDRGAMLPVIVDFQNGEYHCQLHIHEMEDGRPANEIYSCEYNAEVGADAITAYLPTAFLEVGRPYCVFVLARGYGQDWAASEWVPFTVTPGTPQVCFEVVPDTEAYIGQELTVIASVPGASEAYIRWQLGDNDWPDYSWDGEHQTLVQRLNFYQSGTAYGTLYYKGEYDEGFTEFSERIVITVNSRGTLDAPEIDMPMAIDQGDDLVFTIGAVEHADNYGYGLYDRDNWQDVLWQDNVQAGEFTIPAELLVAGHTYDLNVNANGGSSGYDGSFAQRSFFVKIDEDENLTIERGAGDVPVNEDFPVTIHAPGATFVRLYFVGDGSYWRDIWDDHGEGYADYTAYVNVEGPTMIYARASYDDETDDPDEMTFGGMSNTIEVTPRYSGDGTPADVSVQDTISRGELLPVGVTLKDGNDHCRVRVCVMRDGYFEDEVFFCDYDNIGEDGTLTAYVPTAMLQVGATYGVSVQSRGYGQTWADSEPVTFTVTDGTPTICFKVAPEETLIGRNVNVVASVPGASEAYIKWILGNDDWEDHAWDRDRQMLVQTVSFYQSGTARGTLYYKGEYDEDFTAWTEPIEVTVISNGKLDDPEVTVPTSIEAGEDLAVEIGAVDHAQSYYLGVFDKNEGIEVYCEDFDTAKTVTVPSGSLTAWHDYDVYVSAHAEEAGYETSYVVKHFVVKEASEDEITLAIGDGEILVNENFPVTIHAPGATFVRLYFVGDGNYWWDIWDDRGEGYADYTAYVNVEGPTMIYARASYDERIDDPDEATYGGMSNVIEITPDVEGEGTPADVTVSDTIARGVMLPVGVTLKDGNDHCRVRVCAMRDGYFEDEVFFCDYDNIGEDGNLTAYVPTAALEVGATYGVSVQSRGYGQTWAESEWKTFTVADGMPTISVKVVPEEVLIGRNVNVVASVPGASEAYIKWILGNDDWEDHAWDRERQMLVQTVSFNKSGTACGTLYYKFENDEDFTAWTEQIEVTVTSLGKLDDPEITAPISIEAGEMLTFTIGEVENAESYSVDLYDCDDDRMAYWEDFGLAGTFTIPANRFTAGHSYDLNVHAYATGYDEGFARASVFVQDVRDENVTIEIGDGEKFANEDFDLTIHAPGATHVRLYFSAPAGLYWDIWAGDEGYANFTTKVNADRKMQMYVRASYDEDTDDPNEMTYGGMSNVIEVDPTILGEGTAPNIVVPNEVEQGKLMPVEIETFNNTTAVAVQVFSYDDCVFDNWLSVSPSNTSFTTYVPTSCMHSGESYNLVVSAHGYGQSWAWTDPEDGHFSVIESQSTPGPEIIVTPENPKVGDDVNIVANVPGASYVYFTYEPESIVRKNNNDRFEGFASVTVTTNEAQTFNIGVKASFDDGDTEETVLEYPLTFGDNGLLAKPVYTVPETIFAGEGLVVNIDPVEHAELYRFYIVDRNINEVIYTREAATNVTQTVDASVFTAGHDYFVCVVVEAPAGQYSSNGDYSRMVVLDPGTGMTVLSLPTALTTIKEDAFAGTNAQKIIVPAGVERIESGAFSGCKSLVAVEFMGDVDDIADDIFSDTADPNIICGKNTNVEQFAKDRNYHVITK